MIRALAIAALLAAAGAHAASITLADVCEPQRFRQTTAGLEVYCDAGAAPWLTIAGCARPASARVTKAVFCAGTKYVIACGAPSAAAAGAMIAAEDDPPGEWIAVEDEPLLVAAACERVD